MGFFSGLLKGIGKGVVSGAKRFFGIRGREIENNTEEAYEKLLEMQKNMVRPYLLEAQHRYDEVKKENYF